MKWLFLYCSSFSIKFPTSMKIFQGLLGPLFNCQFFWTYIFWYKLKSGVIIQMICNACLLSKSSYSLIFCLQLIILIVISFTNNNSFMYLNDMNHVQLFVACEIDWNQFKLISKISIDRCYLINLNEYYTGHWLPCMSSQTPDNLC